MVKRKKRYKTGRKKNGWYKKPTENWDDIRKLFKIPGKAGLMIKFGLYWALRSGEIVSLKWSDVMSSPGRVLPHLELITAKQSNIRQTSVTRGLKITQDLRDHILAYYDDEGKPPIERYMFYPHNKMSLDDHVTAKTARLWIKRAAREARCAYADIDFHYLRRTSILRYYQKNGLAKTLAMTGHTSPQQLLTYLGITQDVVLDGFDGLWGEEYLSLFEMYEKGMIDISLDLIIRKPADKWQGEVVSRLMAYSNDEREISQLARALLLPYRLKMVRG